jgi:hypothetical protein
MFSKLAFSIHVVHFAEPLLQHLSECGTSFQVCVVLHSNPSDYPTRGIGPGLPSEIFNLETQSPKFGCIIPQKQTRMLWI